MRHLIAIPVYNEEASLARVLEAVARFSEDILVIDDGSTDRTAARITRFPQVHKITHPENRGYGQSLIDAFRFAQERGYDWVITLDCDEQHEPAQIPTFLREAERNEADVLSGSRYLQAHQLDDDAPPERWQINQTITKRIARTLGLKLTDSFCGFKAHRVSAMKRLRLDEPGYAFPLQFWVQCARAGLRVKELPVRRIYRDASRTFGGTLDDPAARLRHYLDVFYRELRRTPPVSTPYPATAVCRCTSPG